MKQYLLLLSQSIHSPLSGRNSLLFSKLAFNKIGYLLKSRLLQVFQIQHQASALAFAWLMMDTAKIFNSTLSKIQYNNTLSTFEI